MNGVTKMSSFGARSAVRRRRSFRWPRGFPPAGKRGSREAAVSRPVVQDVEVVVVRPVPRETTAEALGTVRARTTAAVAPQVMGRLTGVAVSEGSVVAAGALLATIDDTTVRAQLSSAEGAVAEAEAAREEADRAISQAEAGEDPRGEDVRTVPEAAGGEGGHAAGVRRGRDAAHRGGEGSRAGAAEEGAGEREDRPGERPGRRGEGDARLDPGDRPLRGGGRREAGRRGVDGRPRRSPLRPGGSAPSPHRDVRFRDVPPAPRGRGRRSG